MAAVTKRFTDVSQVKSLGATYTPTELADFVAKQMLAEFSRQDLPKRLRILDPAVGDGELLAALLRHLPSKVCASVVGFDRNPVAVAASQVRLSEYSQHDVVIEEADFLSCDADLLRDPFDLIIANPPYVRTQVMGAATARALAGQFGLTGRVDLCHVFMLAIARALSGRGVAGLIVSNRFMTTKSGSVVRKTLASDLHVRHIWDFGDTRLFDAAVLPAVIVAAGRNRSGRIKKHFSSIYQTEPTAHASTNGVQSVVQAFAKKGVVSIPDGRKFEVRHGRLEQGRDASDVWRLATRESDRFLKVVDAHTRAHFGDIGSIRVGVKTCADPVFIRDDWESLPASKRPELLRPLTTHHIARPYRADRAKNKRQIVYPHATVRGKRVVADLADYPRTRTYLRKHAATLRARTYVEQAGRQWYEIWVPQDPAAWKKTKLVFRDIASQPCFWIDKSRSVVNGDCYWLVCDEGQAEDWLWLAAAVGNSTFIETFYDHRFNNRLYAGRRRYLTQYVEKFPLPDPTTAIAHELIAGAKEVYRQPTHRLTANRIQKLDDLVWEAFGTNRR